MIKWQTNFRNSDYIVLILKKYLIITEFYEDCIPDSCPSHFSYKFSAE